MQDAWLDGELVAVFSRSRYSLSMTCVFHGSRGVLPSAIAVSITGFILSRSHQLCWREFALAR